MSEVVEILENVVINIIRNFDPKKANRD
jgi:hypothetical protein